MRIAVTAPIYVTNQEHKRYLDLTTKSIVSSNHDVVWLPCENFVHPALSPIVYYFDHQPAEVKVLHPDGEQSVSKAWNEGIEATRRANCDYVLVINTDIVLKSNAIDRLVDFAEKHPEAVMWTMTGCRDLENLEQCTEDETFTDRPAFCCFMVKANFPKYVGKFDENFVPMYFEDSDMRARIVLAGLKICAYSGARFFHFGSKTIESDQELWKKNSRTFLRNQLYFLEKWGNLKENESEQIRKLYFKHPFNEEDKPLSYCRPVNKAGTYWKFKETLPYPVQYHLILISNWISRNKARIKFSSIKLS